MTHAVNRRRLPRTTVPAILLVLGILIVPAVAPSYVAASSRAGIAAVITTTPVSYRFDAQIVQGAHAGVTIHGFLSGTQDSTGVLTATLTTDTLSPLTPGCGPHVDFGPPCPLPPSANVHGMVMGSGSSATTLLTATGRSWRWVLAGAAAGTASQWSGTLTQGSAYVGTWAMAPTIAVHIDLGARSSAGSKSRITVTGGIALNVTTDGRAVGTFSPFGNTLPVVVQGYVAPDKSTAYVDIPRGAASSLLLIGWSKPGFGGLLNWHGTFVGPAAGEYGTWTGQG